MGNLIPCNECEAKLPNITALSDHYQEHIKALKNTSPPVTPLQTTVAPSQAAPNTFESYLDDQLRMKSKLQALKMLSEPVTPTPSQVDKLQEMALMMKSFKEMFPQRDALEVVKELQALDDIRGSLIEGEGTEPESAQDRVMMILADKLAGKIGGGQQQAAPTTTSSAPVADTTSTVQSTSEVSKVMTDHEVKQTAAQMPEFAKEAIKSGQISLEDATVLVKQEAPKRGVPVPSDADIARIYNEVKNEKDAASEDERQGVKKNSEGDRKDNDTSDKQGSEQHKSQ